MLRRTHSFLRVLLASFAWLATTIAARGEIADRPKLALVDGAQIIVVGECTRVESSVSSRGSMEHTGWFHHIRVERVERDPSDTIRPGDTLVFLSWNDAWRGGSPSPTYGSGHRGLPTKGERRRVYANGDPKAKRGEGPDAKPWLDVLLPNGWQPEGRTIVLIGADDEYRSEVTMPLIAEGLTRDAKASSVVCLATDPASGKPNVENRAHIGGLEALRGADVAVVFMRWREPDHETLRGLSDYFASGAPIVGLRTSTHMLRSTPEMPDTSMNDEWPIRIFGQKWISHHGHDTKTRILPPEASVRSHPILRGISGGMTVPSWLYDVEPLPKDCTILLWGEVAPGANPTPQPAKQPILWVRERGPATPTPFPGRGTPAKRMAFTTLGHPGDFEEREVRRLVEHMVLWAADDEEIIPAEGLDAEPARPYVAPPTR
jgi:hypothetical protein